MISSFAPFTDGFYETGNQVHEWVIDQARAHFARDRARRRAVKDKRSFSTYREERVARFLASIGGLPERRADLATTETGRLVRPGYTIRKLVYRSLPSFHVPALLYVPDGLAKPAPAVFVACGQHADGKAAAGCQRVCIDLVRAGFVVLCIDSPGQGELVQCVSAGGKSPLGGAKIREQSFLQIGATLLGWNIARFSLWNAIRGIDLLVSLPEVDPRRIGATGASGGGCLVQYLMLMEPRLSVAAPCCSLTTRDYFLSTGSRAHEGDHTLFGAIPAGLDYSDFLASFAPRPLLVGAAEFDYLGIEGVLESVEEAKGVYAALGAADLLGLCVAREELHGFSTPLRRGCVDWLVRHLHGRRLAPFTDEPAAEAVATLRCTRSGQVLLDHADSRSILDLCRDEWERRRTPSLALSRRAVSSLIDQADPAPLRVRRTRCVETEFGVAEHLFFFTEPGILTTAVVYVPVIEPLRATLLLIPDGTEGQEPFAHEITGRLEARELVMVFDVRGTGAVRTRRRNPGEGASPRGGESRLACDHFLLGTSLAEKRAQDVKQALRYLRSRSDVGPRLPLEIVGRGWPSLYGLLAACTERHLDACSCEGLPSTWSSAFEVREPTADSVTESVLLPGLAGGIDIEDLLRLANVSPERASAARGPRRLQKWTLPATR